MILATDFDGTLSRGGISETDRQAIIRLRAAGHLYGVVTGRDFGGIYYYLSGEHGVPFDFIIVMNGAMAVDTNGDIIYEKKMDGAVLPELIQKTGDICHFQLGCAIGKKRYEFNAACPEGNDVFAPISKAAEIDTFTMANTRCATEEEASAAVAELNSLFGDVINATQNGVCIDIPAAGIDKGVGIAEYADIMGVPHSAIWTAGDNYNDLAMLKRFRGCAMANGVQAVKDAAHGIYPDIASIIADMGIK